MANDQLGKLITEGTGERDAIHVAIAPATTEERLFPGQSVSMCEGKSDCFEASDNGIGIVDPFLKTPVYPGRRFYVVLNPNTITSLRHVWEHPAFDTTPVSDSHQFIERCAEACGKTYERLMDEARRFIEGGGADGMAWIYDNSERYKMFEDWEGFWKHFEIVTGLRRPEDDWSSSPYTCSC